MDPAVAALRPEVSVMTVHWRLNRGLQLLAATPGDQYPVRDNPAVS